MSVLIPLLLSVVAAEGVVVGKITYPDAPEAARELPVRTNKAVCGKRPIYAEDLLVARDGSLANVVVSVDAPAPAGLAPQGGHLEQEGCVFKPHVQSATQGAVLDIGNSDPVIHNVHALLGDRTVFNLAMPIPGLRVKRGLSEAGLISIRCDSGHDWMSAWVAVFPHPFHATTSTSGEFRIAGLPAGRHRLRAWHERLGTREVEVEVKPGEVTRVSVSFGSEAPEPPPPEVVPPPPPPPVVTRAGLPWDRAAAQALGRSPFLRHCAPCHGDAGDGRGEASRYLDAHPRDFRTGTYMFRTTASGHLPTEDDLVRTIALGLPGTPMPPFSGRLSLEEMRTLARYLMTLSPRFETESPGMTVMLPPAPARTASLVDEGGQLYKRLKCGQCHGPAGNLEDAEQTELEDDWGHPIEATDLTRGVFKGGPDPRALYRTLSTGLDGTPMPSFADVLPPAERWALVYYILSLTSPSRTDHPGT
ncbi:MAG: c-type cytochrome [Myxococcales bacterium]|nr:c-type cytochrome [Myxococcales bacterium]